jgi:hypothetical protein
LQNESGTGPREWLRLAGSGPVVRRALKFAVVVGAILITINHWDAILTGQLDGRRWIKMGLTVLVPYAVSTLSSVGAVMEMRRARLSGLRTPDDRS